MYLSFRCRNENWFPILIHCRFSVQVDLSGKLLPSNGYLIFGGFVKDKFMHSFVSDFISLAVCVCHKSQTRHSLESVRITCRCDGATVFAITINWFPSPGPHISFIVKVIQKELSKSFADSIFSLCQKSIPAYEFSLLQKNHIKVILQN